MAPSIEVPLFQLDRSPHDLAGVHSKQPAVDVVSVPTTPTTPIHQTYPSNTLVLNPAFITQDFDLLRFEAAALDQLPKTNPDAALPTTTQDSTSPSPAFSTSLISSPYNNPGHYLDLTTLSTPSLLFAQALTALQPTTPTYATAPYTQALNFPVVIALLRNLVQQQSPAYVWPTTSFYVVVFRSKLHPDIDNDYLYKLDYESHREACESGGLLKYWFGKKNADEENLATCFWHSREDAYKGGLGPWHVKARKAGREMYERIVFSTWRFVVDEGVAGWRVEEWVD